MTPEDRLSEKVKELTKKVSTDSLMDLPWGLVELLHVHKDDSARAIREFAAEAIVWEQEDERLTEIEKRLEKITPGKWKWDEDGHLFITEIHDLISPTTDEKALCNRNEDADFIAHSPEDVKFLLEEVKRLSVSEGEE
jgi:hypothetical protein